MNMDTDFNEKDIKKLNKLFASQGGKATLKKYGRKHFKKLSKLAAEARKRKKEKEE